MSRKTVVFNMLTKRVGIYGNFKSVCELLGWDYRNANRWWDDNYIQKGEWLVYRGEIGFPMRRDSFEEIR